MQTLQKSKVSDYTYENMVKQVKTIDSRAGKQTGKCKDWLNIIDEKENIENIDWKSTNLWKKDLTESDSFHFTKQYK